MQFLMERLVNRTDPAMGLEPPFDLAAAVAEQIQRIVECRPFAGGRGMRVCDFGMPNIVESSIGMNDHERYGARLAEAIAHYEPRLQDTRLEWVSTGKPLRPRYLIVHGHLLQNSGASVFRFELPCPDDVT
ncbi:GPW/gp25 family protein [Rhodanobacter sp. A1T4]|uniref:GPW/gp25 family protein n=1 Tax=Rhodanobacter sp. A1T4 TaxID=2723087 RepID=UPI0016158403|nr:putative component of type VI protein secretion system [Rhodanobacter sp. A1T4]